MVSRRCSIPPSWVGLFGAQVFDETWFTAVINSYPANFGPETWRVSEDWIGAKALGRCHPLSSFRSLGEAPFECAVIEEFAEDFGDDPAKGPGSGS